MGRASRRRIAQRERAMSHEGTADRGAVPVSVFVERAAGVMDRKLNREADAFAVTAHEMVCQKSGKYRVLVGDRAEEALSFSMMSERDGKTITAFLPLNLALHVLEDVADMLVVHMGEELERPWRKRFASEWAKVNRERQRTNAGSGGPNGS